MVIYWLSFCIHFDIFLLLGMKNYFLLRPVHFGYYVIRFWILLKPILSGFLWPRCSGIQGRWYLVLSNEGRNPSFALGFFYWHLSLEGPVWLLGQNGISGSSQGLHQPPWLGDIGVTAFYVLHWYYRGERLPLDCLVVVEVLSLHMAFSDTTLEVGGWALSQSLAWVEV